MAVALGDADALILALVDGDTVTDRPDVGDGDDEHTGTGCQQAMRLSVSWYALAATERTREVGFVGIRGRVRNERAA